MWKPNLSSITPTHLILHMTQYRRTFSKVFYITSRQTESDDYPKYSKYRDLWERCGPWGSLTVVTVMCGQKVGQHGIHQPITDICDQLKFFPCKSVWFMCIIWFKCIVLYQIMNVYYICIFILNVRVFWTLLLNTTISLQLTMMFLYAFHICFPAMIMCG